MAQAFDMMQISDKGRIVSKHFNVMSEGWRGGIRGNSVHGCAGHLEGKDEKEQVGHHCQLCLLQQE